MWPPRGCRMHCKVAREYIMGQKPLPKSVLVERCFKEGNSPESLEKAIRKLERVYEEVIAKGGDFVLSRLSRGVFHVCVAWRDVCATSCVHVNMHCDLNVLWLLCWAQLVVVNMDVHGIVCVYVCACTG